MFVAEEGVHHLVALVLADLVALSSPIGSSGNVLEDLAAALAAITIGSESRLYFIVRPEDAAQLAVLQTALGGVAFPGVSVTAAASQASR